MSYVRPMTDIEVWTNTPELNALAITINEEYRLANAAAGDAIAHAIACGEALMSARASIAAGHWVRWLADNVDVSVRTATMWLRLAKHKDLVSQLSVRSAEGAARRLYWLGVPRVVDSGAGQEPSFDVTEARALRKQGWTYRRIAEVFEVNSGTIRVHLDHDAYLKQKDQSLARARRRRAERRALAQKERDDAVKTVGGDISVLYSWVRKGAVIVDQAIVGANDINHKEALREIQMALTRTEGAIVKALRVK